MPDARTVLITGATDGLGRALAARLAARGAELLIHGRDEERGRATIADIQTRTGNAKLRWLRDTQPGMIGDGDWGELLARRSPRSRRLGPAAA